MKKAKKAFLTTLIVLVILIVIFFIYELVILRAISINRVKDYISQQGATEQNIESMSVYWDPLKTGGYKFHVRFKDDPGYEYYYKYRLVQGKGRGRIFDLEFNSIELKVSKDGVDHVSGHKYKEIEKS